MQLRPLMIVALLCAGISAPAKAQQAPGAKSGRVTDFGFNLLLAHDSNVSGSSSNLAAARGLSKADTLFSPTVRFNVVQPIGRQTVYLSGTAGYDLHQKNKNLDHKRISMDGGATKQFGFCGASLTGGYSANQSDLGDLSGALVSNVRTQLSQSVGVTCGRPAGLGGAVALQHTESSNSATIQKISNSETTGVSAGLSFGRPSSGTLSTITQYSKSEFPNRPTASGVGDSYETLTLGASYQRRLAERFTFLGQAGTTTIMRKTAPVGVSRNSRAATYSLSVGYTPSQRLTLDALVSRSVVPSNTTGKLYDVSKVVQMSGHYSLGQNLTLTAGGSLIDKVSNSDNVLLSTISVTDSKTKALYGSIRYRRGDNQSVGLNVRHEKRTTDLPAFDYTDTKISVDVDATF